MRVNARLDDEYERQMKFLTEKTGLGVSDVIKASIDHYYRSLRGAEKPQLRYLRTAIGQRGSGHSDIASRSKERLLESLTRKHSSRTR